MNYSSLFKKFISVSQFGINSRMYFSKERKIPTVSHKSLTKPKVRITTPNISVKPEHLFIKEMQEEHMNDGVATVDDVIERFDDRKIEMKIFEKRARFKTIENRYFKEYAENRRKGNDLLTWEMKEHLITLHAMDPETWNFESLCYAFPVTQPEIKALVSQKHKPLTRDELKQHDLRVLENWKKYGNGRIGNISLLKKIITQRISELNKETLPSVHNDPSVFPHDLFFTPTGDHDDEPEMTPRSNQTRKHWFKDIIESYEEQKKSLRKDKPVETELVKCRDLNEVIPNRTSHAGEAQVTVRHRNKPSYLERSNLTWERYKKLKAQADQQKDSS